MSKIFSSASKIVLLVMALAVVAGLFLKIISEETFKTALLMVFTFYFANKGNEENQFLGK
jgi:hypothetical protein